MNEPVTPDTPWPKGSEPRTDLLPLPPHYWLPRSVEIAQPWRLSPWQTSNLPQPPYYPGYSQ